MLCRNLISSHMAPLNESHYAFMSNPHCLCEGKEPPFSPNVIFLFWKEENISDSQWTPQSGAQPLPAHGQSWALQSIPPPPGLRLSAPVPAVPHYAALLDLRALSVVTSWLTLCRFPSVAFDCYCPAVLSVIFKESNRPLETESTFSKR